MHKNSLLFSYAQTPHRCNVSPLRGEKKTQNRPLMSTLNIGALLCAKCCR